jgi:hypothetical protein
MDLDRAIRRFFERPAYQRLFLAFTLGLFISCSVKMAGAEPSVTQDTSHATAAAHWARPFGVQRLLKELD